ncbi:hypothetical protein PoB_000222300 [Plakobranchus ocellatus]|uniref:MYND-type domain-containing protein n=1 Tax=Plakobranchus ocellatus TaxID=259542 RepID=A0AAV3XZS3_9GAST|nr:hypothetical protein PoB_000222300 [Plakobranchus ocellatus]
MASTEDHASYERKSSTQAHTSDDKKSSDQDHAPDERKTSTPDQTADENKTFTQDNASEKKTATQEKKTSTQDYASEKKTSTQDNASEKKTSTQDSASEKKTSTQDQRPSENESTTKDHTSDKSKTCNGAQKEEESGFSINVRLNMEVLAGPPPRIYRRHHQEATELPPVMCPDGEKVKRLENEVMSSPCNVCKFCKKKSSEGFRRCSRCLAVPYCDRDCQKMDFNNHKLFCRRCDRYDIARARVYPVVPIFCNLRHGGDFSVLLRGMPSEFQYDLGATQCNVLLEFLGMVYHFRRYSCLVRDLSGETTKIIFHDLSNRYCHPVFGKPSAPPRDLASCLKPGHFLLLMGVHWRIFSDGTVGIRINDLNSMYIIDMADHDLSLEYKEEMAKRVMQFDPFL